MNNITYRAKRKDNGEWVYGYPYILGEGSQYEEFYIIESLDHRDSIFDIWKGAYTVIPETIERVGE